MLPREPARSPQLGYLYIPPYRVQGISIAGEQSVVQVPELDVAFDIGACPKPILTANYVALTHGHMDHAAALSYYFSQRNFQGIGVGTIVCHPELEQPIHNVMKAWTGLEAQKTPYNVIALPPGEQLEIKNNIYLRAVESVHTVPSLAYVVLEKRSKLRPDLVGQPQEKLVELKNSGEQITQTLEIPLVCYTGDTMWGELFDRPDVLGAKILITECTFLEPGHRGRASVGKHLHLDDIVKLLEKSTAEAVVLTHLSRRTHLGMVRKALEAAVPPEQLDRVFVLMDQRTNRRRFDQQLADAEAEAEAKADS
ncbi:MBL fold metallo-hydrolase [Phycisphaerales bacterium AB-hyl4]|uniref:MBL fold metallo-hydrolase n=1 Tax=Natronomicrosphaera hydrolytica TaxID=3242702 RepID=A0ABV4U6N3_9BACT